MEPCSLPSAHSTSRLEFHIGTKPTNVFEHRNHQSIMSTIAEMQYLIPGRLSDQSARTAVAPEQTETKSEHLLQAILDELRSKNDPNSTPDSSRTATIDFSTGVSGSAQPTSSPTSPSQKDLTRGISYMSASSSFTQLQSGEDRFYQQLFTGVVAFSAFGGSITFQCIFQQMPDTTENKHITPKHARDLIATSWLLFTMDLSLSSIVLAALFLSKMRGPKERESPETWHRILHRNLNLVAALILPLGSVAALIFAALAVSVLSYAVGQTALISVTVLGGAILLWWFSFCLRYYCRRRKERKRPA